MRTYFVSMGCPKNTVDMEATLSLLRGEGHTVTDDPRAADILLVNACSFMRCAWAETLEEVRKLARVKRGRRGQKLVLMGCLPSCGGGERTGELAEVDYFIPPGEHGSLVEILGELGCADRRKRKIPVSDPFAGMEGRELLTPRHFAYVKIAEGCSHTCTFCSIPSIKGPFVSRDPESIAREVDALVGGGTREITLIAQDPASYNHRGLRLPGLVEMLSSCGVRWIRILYLHPASMRSEEVIGLLGSDHVCHYLDVPFQHVSDRLLAKMKRGHDRSYLERFFAEIREAVPDVVFRGEAIVGFPGEREEDFELLKEFVERVSLSSLGIFPFSLEPGTEAVGIPDRVPHDTISARLSELWELQQGCAFSLNSSLLGTSVEVLVEREVSAGEAPCDDVRYAGRYYGQAPEIDGEVFLLGGDGGLSVGRFVQASIVDATSEDLVAAVTG